MENASKALIMAGSVLLGLLILGLLVMMFNNIRDLRNTEATAEDVKALAEYNRQIEMYNRDSVYGVELISLANLISDYNEKQAGLKGYKEITVTVTIKNSNLGSIKEGAENNSVSIGKLLENFNTLEGNVEEYKKTKVKDIQNNEARKILSDYGKTVAQFYGMRTNQIEQHLRDRDKSKSDEKINNECSEIELIVGNYGTLKTELTQFKNTPFSTSVKYDENTGRVYEMAFDDK